MARRTAPDPAAAGMGTLAADAPKIGRLLERSGVRPAEFRIGANNYISPALLSYGRREAFCNHPHTRGSIHADTGQQVRSTRNILLCERLKQVHSETEAIYRDTFATMVRGVGLVGREFGTGIAAPVRAEGNGLLRRVGFGKTFRADGYGKGLAELLREKE